MPHSAPAQRRPCAYFLEVDGGCASRLCSAPGDLVGRHENRPPARHTRIGRARHCISAPRRCNLPEAPSVLVAIWQYRCVRAVKGARHVLPCSLPVCAAAATPKEMGRRHAAPARVPAGPRMGRREIQRGARSGKSSRGYGAPRVGYSQTAEAAACRSSRPQRDRGSRPPAGSEGRRPSTTLPSARNSAGNFSLGAPRWPRRPSCPSASAGRAERAGSESLGTRRRDAPADSTRGPAEARAA